MHWYFLLPLEGLELQVHEDYVCENLNKMTNIELKMYLKRLIPLRFYIARVNTDLG